MEFKNGFIIFVATLVLGACSVSVNISDDSLVNPTPTPPAADPEAPALGFGSVGVQEVTNNGYKIKAAFGDIVTHTESNGYKIEPVWAQ